jgi:hypothetical protein
LLGPGPSLVKKNLPGRGLTKVEKHWPKLYRVSHSLPNPALKILQRKLNRSTFVV